AVRAEVAWIFLAAGAVGILYYGSLFRTRSPAYTTSSLLLGVPIVTVVGGDVALGTMLGKLLTFFLKAGSLIFGSGLVIVPFRANLNVQGFIKGAYAAAIGTILGACDLLGRIAIGDWFTALVMLVSLVVLFRWKVINPLLFAAAAMIGLIAVPLLQPTWVFVK